MNNENYFRLLTIRKFAKLNSYKFDYSWYDIVFEWEDIIMDIFPMYLYNFSKFMFWKNRIYKYTRKYLKFYFPKKNSTNYYVIYFEMSIRKYDSYYNRKNFIPCIIDYYVPKLEYNNFVSFYCNCKVILISSREVYTYLIENIKSEKIKHFPLSISDKWIYELNHKYEKKYDIVLAGRQNPVLLEWLRRYVKENNKIKIIITRKENIEYFKNISNVDILIRENDTRDGYMDLLQNSKIMLYATPGIDGGEDRTNGWNQITPRFLEGIVSQCHIIARYPKNEDTIWYEIEKFSPNIECYEQFVERMNYVRFHEVDLYKYHEYIKKHLTSSRVKLLKKILKESKLL